MSRKLQTTPSQRRLPIVDSAEGTLAHSVEQPDRQLLGGPGWMLTGVVKFEGSLLHNSNQHLLWFLLCTARHRLCGGGHIFFCAFFAGH